MSKTLSVDTWNYIRRAVELMLSTDMSAFEGQEDDYYTETIAQGKAACKELGID